jgi:hypothetical protein
VPADAEGADELVDAVLQHRHVEGGLYGAAAVGVTGSARTAAGAAVGSGRTGVDRRIEHAVSGKRRAELRMRPFVRRDLGEEPLPVVRYGIRVAEVVGMKRLDERSAHAVEVLFFFRDECHAELNS